MMQKQYTLWFERALSELEVRIETVKQSNDQEGGKHSAELVGLEAAHEQLLRSIFAGLSPWEHCLMAQHSKRPYTLDFIHAMLTDFAELHGDRTTRDDPAIVGGIANLHNDKSLLDGRG